MAKQTKSKAAQTNEKRMKLTGHLKELRNRLIVCLLFLFVGTIVGLGFAPRVVEHLLGMGEVYGYQYVYLAPQELLMQYMSVALIFGLVCAMPVIMYEVWAFARPGLSKRENIAFVCSLIFGTACFCAGVYFAYRIMLPTMLLFLSTLENYAQVAAAISVQNYISFLLTIFIIFGVVFELPVVYFAYRIMLPFMLQFLIGVSLGTDISAAITVGNYISFLLTMFVIFGLVFELPVVSVMLTQLGILKVEWMKKARRFVIVISFVVAAIITPPDVVSQIMVGIPMLILYQLSIILCMISEKLRRRYKKPEDDGESDTDGEEDTSEQ